MGRLSDRVALVTGAASGIGNACARRFAEEGARVAGLDVQEPGPDWQRVVELAPDAEFFPCDVRNDDAIAKTVQAVVDQFGAIDALVNAAGVSGAGSVTDCPIEEWDRVVDINLKGTYLVSRHVVPHMLARGRGSVVNLASIEGLEGMNSQAAYNASKGGVVLLTRNMAIDYGPAGIRVNCLCPGLIETPMTEILRSGELKSIHDEFIRLHMLKRPGKPEEVAACALFLVSDDASFVTGHALTVDGGMTAGRQLLPGEGAGGG